MDAPAAMSEGERAWVVGECARLTGERASAQDLAQEVLLRAHAGARSLRDPSRRSAWLAGIARHVCTDWVRRRGREPSPAAWEEGDVGGTGVFGGAGRQDLVAALERKELTTLLDRAMAHLSAPSRRALVLRYVEDLPLAEVAGRLGLTEGAAAMRLQRGREALRRTLTARFREDAAAFGLLPPLAADGWQESRLWCPECSQRRLWGRWGPAGDLQMDCLDCAGQGRAVHVYTRDALRFWGVAPADLFGGVRAFKPALNRISGCVHALFGRGVAGQTAVCPHCGALAHVRVNGMPFQGHRDIEAACAVCGWVEGFGTSCGIAMSCPEAVAFTRRHGRTRLLPAREVEAAGVPALVERIEAITGSAVFDRVLARDTLRPL